MRKTFLKVALIGLLVGSLPVGFTSCKDYDDDIENTNNKVADLQTKLSSVETAIAALPSKADVTAAQAAAVAQAKADLEAVKAQLQAAIDGKASAEDVAAINGELSKIQGQLETLDALKADVATALEAVANITELDSKLQAQGQLIAGIQAQIAELTENGTTQFADITKQLEALKTAVEDPANGLDALKAEIAKLAEEIQGQGGEAASLAATLRVINGMVTSIRFVSNPTNVDNGDFTLTLYNPVTVDQTPVGPDGEKLLFEMKKGDRKDFEDAVLVQVSPAGATLTKEQLTLVNSQLDSIPQFVSIKSVEPYKDLLTSRAVVSKNGLYKVTFILNPEYDFENDEADEKTGLNNFQTVTMTEEGKYVRFAIAVSEENEAGQRDIMTPYDLTVVGGKVNNLTELKYEVAQKGEDAVNVSGIHNRFLYAADGSSYMYAESEVTNALTNMDGAYAKAAALANYDAAKAQGYLPVGDYHWNAKGQKVCTGMKDTDNRTSQPYYMVNEGVDFTVSLTNVDGVNPVYGYYVALDLRRATESDKSEAAAWQKYAQNNAIKGLNEVCEDGKITLNITKEANVPAGDVIGFRVWAVNYDGTLVDPDGRAFYVQVGEENPVTTGALDLAFTKFDTKAGETTIASYEDVLDWTTKYTSVKVSFIMNNNDEEVEGADKKKYQPYLAGSDASVTVSFPSFATPTSLTSKVGAATASTLSNVNAADYSKLFNNIKITATGSQFVDGVTYEGAITITSTGSHPETLQIIPVTITKNVPKTLPANFAVANGLIDANNNINIYATKGDVENGVIAYIQNVFFEGNEPVQFGNVWGIDLTIKNAVAGSTDWDGNTTPAKPAYLMNGINDGGYAFKFEGYEPETGSAMWKTNTGANSILGGNGNIAAISQITPAILEPTLPIINNDVKVLTIWRQYNGVSYVATYDSKGKPTANPSPKPCLGKGTFNLKVQTYANTYEAKAAAMPTLKFREYAAINYNAITLTSKLISMVNNTTISAAEKLADQYKVVPQLGSNGEMEMSGAISQYFTAIALDNPGVSGQDGALSIDVATGKVTVLYKNMNIPVNGVPVVNRGSAATPKYDWADAASLTKTIIFVPSNLTNAPLGNLTGSFDFKFTDGFGLGSGFAENENEEMEVVPYSLPIPVTMIP